MRRLLACLFLALLSFWMANPAEAGRRRGNAEPVLVYFPPSFHEDGSPVDPFYTYLVQIPERRGDGWETVYEIEQGGCLRYDRKLAGESPPYWVRMCWTVDPTLCSEPAVECDPLDPAWSLRGIAPEDACSERACLAIH